MFMKVIYIDGQTLKRYNNNNRKSTCDDSLLYNEGKVKKSLICSGGILILELVISLIGHRI